MVSGPNAVQARGRGVYASAFSPTILPGVWGYSPEYDLCTVISYVYGTVVVVYLRQNLIDIGMMIDLRSLRLIVYTRRAVTRAVPWFDVTANLEMVSVHTR